MDFLDCSFCSREYVHRVFLVTLTGCLGVGSFLISMFSGDIDTNSLFVLAFLNSSLREFQSTAYAERLNSLPLCLRIPDGLWRLFFAQWSVLWEPCCVSCCFLTLDGAHRKYVAVHCGNTVESYHLVSHRAAQLCCGARFRWRQVVGRYLLFGVCVFQGECDSAALKL